MKENLDEIIIQASPEKVWSILTNLSGHAEWNPMIYRAQGKIETGQTVKLSAKSGSFDMKYNCFVVKVIPNREFIWKWHVLLPFLIRGEHAFSLEPISEENVRFINKETFRGLLVPFLTKELTVYGKKSTMAMDKALKIRAEKG